MLITFLSGALADSGAEADSSVVHFSQAQQKILLNHIQLISLASGFPLKWPDVVQNMFEVFSLFGNAGSYVFNPACNDWELVEGEKAFFQKSLGIVMLPFFAVFMCALFWYAISIHNYIDPPEHRQARQKKNIQKKKNKLKLKQKHIHDKKYEKTKKKRVALIERNDPLNDQNPTYQNAFTHSLQTTTADSIEHPEAKNETTPTPTTIQEEVGTTADSIENPEAQNEAKNEPTPTPTTMQEEVSNTTAPQRSRSRSDSSDNSDNGHELGLDGNNEQVQVIRLLVHPLAQLGILWESTAKIKRSNKMSRVSSVHIVGTIQQKYVARIKKIKGKHYQAALVGLQRGDVLQTMSGKPVVSMTLADLKQKIKLLNEIAEPYELTFIRKVHRLKERVQKTVRDNMSHNKSTISIFDKFIATVITVLYLLYPTGKNAGQQPKVFTQYQYPHY